MICIPARRGFGLEMKKSAVISLKMVTCVGFVFGPGETPTDCMGSGIYSAEDRWGKSIVVLMDDETKGDCGPFKSVTTFTERGIGAYILEA